MTTTNVTAMTRAVCADPLDLSLRAICADAMEEAGEVERAEFIRVQCELAKTPEWEGIGEIKIEPNRTTFPGQLMMLNKRHMELSRRAQVLLRKHGYDWTPRLPGVRRDKICFGTSDEGPWLSYADDCPAGARFRNGFVEVINTGTDFWLRHGSALVLAAPLTEVVLTDKEPIRGLDAYWVRWEALTWPREEWDTHEPPPSRVPRPIFDKLTGADYGQTWRTRADALISLSRAAIAWAREQAGLPALKDLSAQVNND